MSFSLSWRRVALACVLVIAAAGVLASWALPGAGAQEPPPSATFVFSNIPVTASTGHVNLGPGTGTVDGVLGIACTGAAPRGGTTKIPGQVVAELLSTSTRLRIVQANGIALTGSVRINCAVDVELTAAGSATADRLRAKAANAG
jgi:hypothetical protein